MIQTESGGRRSLGEAAPGGEVEFLGFAELEQVAVEARAFGEELENAPLIEDVDLVFPDHVIDGREAIAVAHERGGEDGEVVRHMPSPPS
jgi:hypothetical protein